MLENKFPEAFEVALAEVAVRSGWSLRKYEYHGVEVRELRRWEGKTLRKVQASQGEERKIEVIIRKDTFKNLPKLRVWLHNNIPMFPYTADVTWRAVEPIGQSLSGADYEKVLVDLVATNI